MNTVETAICEVEQEVRRQMAPQSYKVAGAESSKHSVTVQGSRAKRVRAMLQILVEQELEVTRNGIKRTEKLIQAFETKYGLAAEEFQTKYRNGELTETMETIEWLGEYQLLEGLKDDLALLAGLNFGN